MTKPCLLIPIYDHGETIDAVVSSLERFSLPLLIVDDGSHDSTRRTLEQLSLRNDWVSVERHDHNRGRGAALKTGYRAAYKRGFSHVIQLDADGQHNTPDIPRFVAALRRAPKSLVLGAPIFDDSIPKARLYGRQLSRAMVWISTLSLAVEDPLCGFRAIPLRETTELLDETATGDHMEFDPELCVRMAWKGVRIGNVPTPVRYHAGGLSHFDAVRDNVRLTSLYARLLAGSLVRIPRLIRLHQRREIHA